MSFLDMKHVKRSNRYILTGQEYAELVKGSDLGYKSQSERLRKQLGKITLLLEKMQQAGLRIDSSCMDITEDHVLVLRKDFGMHDHVSINSYLPEK